MMTAFSPSRPAVAIAAGILMTFGVVSGAAASENRHGAHQHGVSKLNLVIDGKHLEMELVSPGADIVGFEHPAASDADRRAIAKAAAVLKDGARLFSLPAAARCVLEASRVEAPETDAHEGHHAGHGDEKKHAHGHGEKEHAHGHDGRKSGHEHEHKHGHEHEKAGGETHSEFHARYRFACERPDRLTHIDVTFFKAFPGAKEIEARAVTPDRQIRRELTADAPRLTL